MREYPVAEVRSLETQGLRFVVHSVVYNPSPRYLPRMQSGRVYPDLRETVFLQQLVGGAVDLFRYTSGKGTDHFYLGRDGKAPDYLRFERQLLARGNREQTQAFDTYPEQVLARFADCPRAGELVTDLPYTAEALRRTITELVACTGAKLVAYDRKRRRLQLGVTVGASLVTTGTPYGQIANSQERYFHREGVLPNFGLMVGYQTRNLRMKPRLRAVIERHILLFNAGMAYRPSLRVPVLLEGGALLGVIVSSEGRKFHRPSNAYGSDFGAYIGAGYRWGRFILTAEGSFVRRTNVIEHDTRRWGLRLSYLMMR